MKSNIGFLQILALLIFIFNVFGLLDFSGITITILLLIAWSDSYSGKE